MSLTNDKFRTPKGDTFVDADGATVTIASASTWTADSGLVYTPVLDLGDFDEATGKIEPNSFYPQKSKMRLKWSVSAHATTGTNELNVRIVDAANSNTVLSESDEGAQSAVTTTPQTFTGDDVVEIPTNADIVVQVRNNTDTDNVVITDARISLWHP